MHPLETATPERQGQNTDFTESKASFVVYEMKKRLRGMSFRGGVLYVTKVFTRSSSALPFASA